MCCAWICWCVPLTACDLAWRQHQGCLLHLAAEYDRLALVRPVLDMGADVNAMNKFGHTPINYACGWGHREVAVELAMLGADPTIKSTFVSLSHTLWSYFASLLRANPLHVWAHFVTRPFIDALSTFCFDVACF